MGWDRRWMRARSGKRGPTPASDGPELRMCLVVADAHAGEVLAILTLVSSSSSSSSSSPRSSS
eukprot:2943423-Rhodomonas_salina.1